MQLRKILTLILAFLIFVFFVVFFTVNDLQHRRIVSDFITVKNIIVNVDIADSHSERIRGLSGVAELEEKTGLLFVFDEPDRHGIWMKDMLIPLDVIWFDEDRTIIHIEESISPDSYPQVFRSEKNALYILEVQTGFVSQYNISVGDSFFFE